MKSAALDKLPSFRPEAKVVGQTIVNGPAYAAHWVRPRTAVACSLTLTVAVAAEVVTVAAVDVAVVAGAAAAAAVAETPYASLAVGAGAGAGDCHGRLPPASGAYSASVRPPG